MTTEIIERPLTGVSATTDEGSHDRYAHIVLEGFWSKDEEGERTGEFVGVDNSIVDSMITGTPVKALCGKMWVPGEDPGKYKLCPTCINVAKQNGWKVPGA